MQDKAICEEQVKAMLKALNAAYSCLSSDNDIESAIAGLDEVRQSLRILLPGAGIYAWTRSGMDNEQVRVFPSVKEAEESLNIDINMTIQDLGDMDDTDSASHRGSIKEHGKYLVTVCDRYSAISWRRMYDPGKNKDAGTQAKEQLTLARDTRNNFN